MQENSYASNISLPAMGEPLSFSGGMKTIALTHSGFIYSVDPHVTAEVHALLTLHSHSCQLLWFTRNCYVF